MNVKILIKSNLVLICIMILSIFLNIYNLDTYPLNPDEVVYTAQSAIWAGHDEYSKNFIPYSRSATNFQIHQLITGIFIKIFGLNEFNARLPAAIIGILLVLATYFLGNELFNKRVGLFAALFMSTSAYLLHFNRQIHLDTPMVFFMVLSILFLVKWYADIREYGIKKDIYFYLGLISVILATMTKVIIIVPLILLIIYYLYMKKELINSIKMLRKPVSILIMLIALLYAIYFITSVVGLEEYLKTFSFAISRESEHPVSYIDVMLEFFGYFFVAIIIIGLIYLLTEKRTEKRIENILVVIWFFSVLILFSIYPLKGYSYILPITPAVALLNGRVFDNFLSKFKRPKFVVMILLVIIGMTVYPTLFYSYGTLWDLNNSYEVQKRFDPVRYMAVKDAGIWLKNNVDQNSGVIINKFASHHGLAFYSNLKTYTFEYYPSIYMPTEENAEAVWEDSINTSELIKNGDINYIVDMNIKGYDVKDILSEMNKENINFTSVYYKSYMTPRADGGTYNLNITIYKVQIYKKILRFITIGDPHISANNTHGGNERLKRIIKFINDDMKNVDSVIFMGDMTDRGSDEENEIVKNILKNLTKPYYVVAGNRDISISEDNFRQNYGPIKHIENIKGYQLLFIGIFNRKDESGNVIKFGWSFNFTNIDKEKPTLVFVHGTVKDSPPECTSCNWTKEFFRYGYSMESELNKFTNLFGVYSGHVHYDSDQMINGVRYITINGLVNKEAGGILAQPSDKIGYTTIENNKLNYSLISYKD